MYIICLLYTVLIKLFFLEYSDPLSLPLSLITIYYFSKKNSALFEYLFLLILFNSALVLFCTLGVILTIYFFNKKSKGYNKSIIIYFVFSLVLGFLSFKNFHAYHDILRFVTLILILPIGFVFYRYPYNERRTSFRILYTFMTLFVVNALYISFISDNFRLSVFNGSENIAAIVFSLLALYLMFSRNSVFERYTVFICLLFFTFMSESRTAILIPVIISIVLFIHSISIRNIIKFSLLFSLTASIVIYTVDMDSISNDRKFRIVENLTTLTSDGISFESFASIDTRGALIVEGAEKISKNVFFGHGVVLPELFKIIEPDIKIADYHNIIIDILVTYGVVGLLMFGLFFVIFYTEKGPSKTKGVAYYNAIFLLFFLTAMLQPYMFNVQALSLFMLVISLLKLKPNSV